MAVHEQPVLYSVDFSGCTALAGMTPETITTVFVGALQDAGATIPARSTPSSPRYAYTRRTTTRRACASTTSTATAGVCTTRRSGGLCTSTGVVEAGCKVAIGTRCKRAGMHWTVAGADAIIALRCCKLSGRFEDFWERRSSARAAVA